METMEQIPILSDESVERFNLLHYSLLDNDNVWYSMRAEENHLLYGNLYERKNKINKYSPNKRYFNCFYNSFKERQDKFYISLINELLKIEYIERTQINEHEIEEFYAICRYAGDVFGVPQWSRLYSISLPIPEAEEMERRMIKSEYFSMFLEATSILEILHRREIMFINEPSARKKIQAEEVHNWIESRKRQVENERQKELVEKAKERQYDLAYHNWKSRQAYQVFLFEQSEQEERMNIERLQRLYAGTLAQIFRTEHKEARYHQLKYEMRQRILSPELSREIMSKEASERSSIMVLQRDSFQNLQVKEVKSFLWTRKNILMNEKVESERKGERSKYIFM